MGRRAVKYWLLETLCLLHQSIYTNSAYSNSGNPRPECIKPVKIPVLVERSPWYPPPPPPPIRGAIDNRWFLRKGESFSLGDVATGRLLMTQSMSHIYTHMGSTYWIQRLLITKMRSINWEMDGVEALGEVKSGNRGIKYTLDNI